MRLVFGPPPDAPDFSPELQGWRRLREPAPGDVVSYGTLIGFGVGALAVVGWKQIHSTRAVVKLAFDSLDPIAIFTGGALHLLTAVGLFIAVIVVHEFIHALASPMFGMTRATAIGLWPQFAMPYATHTGPLRARRFLVVALAPLLVMSIAPPLLALATGAARPLWVMVSVVNAFLSGGDVMVFCVVVAQVPLGAWVRNKGWDGWWHAA